MPFISQTATAVLLAASAMGAAPVTTSDDSVNLKTVQYPDLIHTMHALQGRVVVVDFWGEY
jgi:hypothetical protein